MTTLSPPQTEINSVIALYSNGQIQEALTPWKRMSLIFRHSSMVLSLI